MPGTVLSEHSSKENRQGFSFSDGKGQETKKDTGNH